VSSSLPSSGLGLLTPYSCLSTVRLHPGTLLHVLVSALSSCSSPLSDMLKGLLDLMEHLGISKTMPQRLALPLLSLSLPRAIRFGRILSQSQRSFSKLTKVVSLPPYPALQLIANRWYFLHSLPNRYLGAAPPPHVPCLLHRVC
jgi:hypothetical protein